jgi:DNA replication protein DnaC
MSSLPNKTSPSASSTPKRSPRARVPRTSLPPRDPSPAAHATPPRRPPSASNEELKEQFRELRLPMFREHFQRLADQATRESLSHPQYLAELTRLECQARRERRIQRLLEQSRLPRAKSWENFDWKRIPLTVARQAESLRDGSFLDRRENLLVFGKPGSGKTHCVCALAERLVHQGRTLLFTTCGLLVQSLLAAKRDLRFEKAIKQLSRFEGLILDDLGYVQHSREEMEVLFTLLAERYERGSVLLTSNLAFSQWEQIFKDPMTTAAAIDRLVHHCVVWELNVSSYRLETAQQNRRSSSPTSPGPQEA